MSLKQSVVVVNEYTIKTGTKSGSRGGTPGDYVLRYMARNLATEGIAPERLQDDDKAIVKYMARKEAVETTNSIPKMKRKMRDAQKYGGVAFGYGDVALSDEGLKRASKDIQKQFDSGKTVLKTVLSFDEEYLREHGIISEDFVCKKRGDYRGHIDQLKLRLAIMNGLEKMGRNYDDLQYVGVLQVDTKHVHCHLAMVDRGKGNVMPDGTQRGKLTEKEKVALRRGIDMWLDEKQVVKSMSSSVMYDKRNALCYIKKYTHKTMLERGFSQFLLACLPDNKNWWRAASHRKEMQKANALVREFVNQLLEEPNSGYREAMQSVEQYAGYRKEREGLEQSEYEELIRYGQNRIVEDCINGVYSVLKQIPDVERQVRTPLLESMSQNYDDMAADVANDPMVEFGFRLRSYASRLDHHRKEYHKYQGYRNEYELAEDKEEASKPLGDYFKIEAEYNAMLMMKYQHFLSFLPADEGLEDEFNELMKRKDSLRNLQKMRADKAFSKMKYEDTANEYGLRVYGQYGGARMLKTPEVIDGRIRLLEQSILKQEQEFRMKLQDYGMDYDGHGIKRQRLYSFDTVKALDLHHMGYDFPYDARISKRNIDNFCDMAEKRYEAFVKAREYLELTGQAENLSELPVRDVEVMYDFASKFRKTGVLTATRPTSGQHHKVATVSLDNSYQLDMKEIVQATVRGLQFDGF